MSIWRTVRLVMGREFASRKRAFLIAAAAILVLGSGVIMLVAAIGEGDAGPGITGDEADELLAFLGVVILFMAIIFTGQVVMEGVAEEKRSRVVEVVLGTMRARHLLLGKVTAIGLLGLAEVILLCGVIAIAGSALDVFTLPRGSAAGLLAVVGWFVLGFALYSMLYGAGGAMVAPHENVNSGAIPINLTLGVAYIVSLLSNTSGDSVLLRVLSLFPPTAPLSMPMRMIRGFAAPWEVGLSVVLTVVAAYGLMRLTGRLYAGAVMRVGRVRWRDAWRAAAHLG